MSRMHFVKSLNKMNVVAKARAATLSALSGTSRGTARSTTHINSQLVGGVEGDPRNRSGASSFMFSENVVGNMWAKE